MFNNFLAGFSLFFYWLDLTGQVNRSAGGVVYSSQSTNLCSTKTYFRSCRGFFIPSVSMEGRVSSISTFEVVSRALISLESITWLLFNLTSLFFLQLVVLWSTDLHKKQVIWSSMKRILNLFSLTLINN